jgi:hypothetical protein
VDFLEENPLECGGFGQHQFRKCSSLAEPNQGTVEDRPMGDVLRVKFFRMGETFDARSDSLGSVAMMKSTAWREPGESLFSNY